MPRLRDMTDKELIEEWLRWDLKVRETDGWVHTTADEFRQRCSEEIDRRRDPP